MCRNISIYNTDPCRPAGPDVLQGTSRHRGLPGPGQWSGGSLQAEGSQQIAAVHWAGLSGYLSHLHGEALIGRRICSMAFFFIYFCYLTSNSTFSPLGVLAAAQWGGQTGLPEPHRRGRAHSDAHRSAVWRSSAGLPHWVLHPDGRSNPGHHPSSGHPAHRRKLRILAQQPQGGVLEPDEADRPQCWDFRRCAHLGHWRVDISGF